MKKLILIALSIALCLSVVACGTPANSTEKSSATTAAAVTEAIATAAATTKASAADTTAAKETFKVAISLPPANNAWQAALLKSIQEATAGDTQIEWTVKNATDDADQTNILTTFKDGGYDLIACLPGDGTLQTTILEEIYAAGIPTVIIDRGIESKNYTSFVGEDNYSCGVLGADFIGKFFEGQKDIKLVNLRSYAGIPIDLQRFQGFMDTIVKYTNIEIIGEGDGQFNSEAGFKAMSDLLAAKDKIDVVFTQDDEATTGAMTAIEQAGRTDIKLIVSGGGGTVTGMNDIKNDNTIHKATASYFPRIGAQAVDVIREYLTTGKIAKDNTRASTLLTKDNVQDFLAFAYQ